MPIQPDLIQRIALNNFTNTNALQSNNPPQLSLYIVSVKKDIDAVLTKIQSDAFWDNFYAVTCDLETEITLHQLNKLLVFALSRDIDKNNPKVQDALEMAPLITGTTTLCADFISAKTLQEVSVLYDQNCNSENPKKTKDFFHYWREHETPNQNVNVDLDRLYY